MLDTRSFNRSREIQCFFEIAVRDLHLVVIRSDAARAIPTSAGDIKRFAMHLDHDIFGGNAREFDLDDPAFACLIDIRGRIPKVARADVAGRRNELEMTIYGLCHIEIRLFILPKPCTGRDLFQRFGDRLLILTLKGDVCHCDDPCKFPV